MELKRGGAIVLAIVVLGVPAIVAGFRAHRTHWENLIYDECEYVQFALQTHDRIAERGLSAWPRIIFNEQHYAKPPLLVNCLAFWLLVLGRAHINGALAVHAGLSMLLLMLPAYLLARRVWSDAAALLTALAIGAIPAVARFAGEVYPEALVAALLLAYVAVLFWPNARWTLWRALLAGICVGLGLWAKVTFPSLAVGPTLVWLIAGASGGPDSPFRRIGWLTLSAIPALLIAAGWYTTSWQEALEYVRTSYRFVTGAVLDEQGNIGSKLQIAAAWGRMALYEGVGLSAVGLLIGAVVLGFLRVRSPNSNPDRRKLLIALVLAAAPMLIGAVSSPNVSRRLLLPALTVLVVAAACTLAASQRGRWREYLRRTLIVMVVLQWCVLRVAGLLPVEQRKSNDFVAAFVDQLSPSYSPRGKLDRRPVDAIVAAARELNAEGYASTFYLISNHSEVCVPRLDLICVAEQAEVDFEWGAYADWAAEDNAAALRAASAGPNVLIEYAPGRPLSSGDKYANRLTEDMLAKVQTEPRPFRLWRSMSVEGEAGFTLRLYRNFDSDEPALWPERLVNANFGDRIFVSSVAATEGQLILKCVGLRKMPIRYKVMLHAVPEADSSAAAEGGPSGPLVWDAFPPFPTRSWTPGRLYRLSIPIPDARPGQRYRIELGFFDESDAEHHWPALPRMGVPESSSLRLDGVLLRTGE